MSGEETLGQLNEALGMYLENQRSLQDMISANPNEELRTLKIEVDIAIEQIRVQLQRRLAASALWTVGDICQVRWEDGVWYTCTLTQPPAPPSQLWGVRLLGFGIDGEVPPDRVRTFEKPLLAKGTTCLALHNGVYLAARVDSVVDEGQFVWVTFTQKAIASQCVKVPITFITDASRTTPAPQRKRYAHTAEEEKQRAEAENARKIVKRDKFRKKKQAEDAVEEQRRATWKEHQKKTLS